MRTKEVTVSLALNAQPKQFHSMRLELSATVEISREDEDNLATAITGLRESLSLLLADGMHEEIRKIYGEAAADAVLLTTLKGETK